MLPSRENYSLLQQIGYNIIVHIWDRRIIATTKSNGAKNERSNGQTANKPKQLSQIIYHFIWR